MCRYWGDEWSSAIHQGQSQNLIYPSGDSSGFIERVLIDRIFAAGKTSDWIGRRYTIVLAAATFFIGALLMGLAPSYPFLMAGRVVAGIGVGYSLMIAPVYTAEISPAMTRGFLSSFPEVFINIGILLG